MSLPDSFPTGRRMARALVTYIDCPHRVRHEIRVADLEPPHVETIRKMRADYLADRDTPQLRDVFKAHEGYYPADVSFAADDANRRFVGRLVAARR